jgi:exocyst complex component 4
MRDGQPRFTSPWAQSSATGVEPLKLNRGRSNGLPARPVRSSRRPPSSSGSPDPSQTVFAGSRFQNRRPDSALSFASITDDEDAPSPVASSSRAAPASVDDFENQLQRNQPVPKAMNTVLAALADAGQRNRSGSGSTLPVAQPQKRTRRGGVGEQGESSRMKPRNTADYPATPAFREIQRVLVQIEDEWPSLMPLESEDGTRQDFSPIQVALALLDTDNGGRNPRLQSFLRLKEDLSKAVKMHIQLHYRAFDASVSAYNSTLANLGSAQKEVVQLRNKLGDVREVLSTRRSELVAMVARRDELSEMSKILDSM